MKSKKSFAKNSLTRHVICHFRAGTRDGQILSLSV